MTNGISFIKKSTVSASLISGSMIHNFFREPNLAKEITGGWNSSFETPYQEQQGGEPLVEDIDFKSKSSFHMSSKDSSEEQLCPT